MGTRMTGTEDGRMKLTMGPDGKWEFERATGADCAHNAIDSALDRLDAGRASAEGTEARLQEIATEWPANIEAARAHGVSLDAIGATHRAHQEYRRGFGLAETALGDRKVEMNWYVFMNRPFLRAAAAMVHVLREEQKPAKAATLIRKMLRWCPQDNLGMREKLGRVLLEAGNQPSAVRALRKASPTSSPAVDYDLGLALITGEEYAEAAVALQRGLLRNPYTGEMLVHGTHSAMNMAMACIGSDHGQEGATEYVDEMSQAWEKASDALAFLRWVQTEPVLAVRRGTHHACEAALLWEQDASNLGQILQRQTVAADEAVRMDFQALVAPRSIQTGEKVQPWKRIDEQEGTGIGQRRTRMAGERQRTAGTGMNRERNG